MKVVAIIQARIGSKRLPGKAMLILQNKPILEHIINFLKFSKKIDQIVVATTNLSEDIEIVNLSKKLGISYFCGDSENVLNRYLECAKKFSADIIVRITSDDPLIDSEIVDKIIEKHIRSKSDYSSNVLQQTYPIGFSSCEVFNFSILEQLSREHNYPENREHVTHHLRKHYRRYNTTNISAPKSLQRPSWRLTIDYIDDYNLMKKIFENLYVSNQSISYEKLVKFLDEHPEILEINSKHHEYI